MNLTQAISIIHPTPLVAEALNHTTCGTALDLAAGSGRNSLFLAAQGFIVTSVDRLASNLEVLDFAASLAKFPITTIVAEPETFETSETYDLVIATLVLHFIDKELLTTTIQNFKSMTKPGGVNVLLALADKTDDGARPSIFASGELKGLYSDWRIIQNTEQLSSLNDQRHYHRSGLIAKRPAS
jgi:tellurite methyltransferase